MTDDVLRECIENACAKINVDGFYVGMYIEGVVSTGPTETVCDIQQTVSAARHCNVLHSPYISINPHQDATVLYKVDSGLFKAFPICKDNTAFTRFFMLIPESIMLSGIALVSHKLKMLSFIWACYSLDDQDEHVAFIAHTHRAVQWAYTSKSLNEDYYTPDIQPNDFHIGYIEAFACNYVCPWEICLSIDDHWKNELLYENVNMNRIIEMKEIGIARAKKAIVNEERRIAEYSQQIEEQQQAFEKFKTDIFKSRVDAELLNVY